MRSWRLPVLVLLLAVTGCGTIVKDVMLRHPKVRGILDEPVADHSVTTQGSVTTIGEGDEAITVLHVRGTPYEMGYQQGRLLGKSQRQSDSRVNLAV